ncbi:dephospho-CoA kinase [Eubacteriales bacterium OttesenSCG-928-G02]|nr:dephospho-CoA kinase [Eubacteriales bacterium OttesenSCG-928-G02]
MKKLIGISGRSGSGKSSVANLLKNKGYKIIDADEVSREVISNNKQALAELSAHFGNDILNSDGKLDRSELFKKGMSSPEEHKILNKITHKYILLAIDDIINSSKENLIFLDAPLLFEASADKKCDKIIAVISDEQNNLNRIMKRDNITKEKAELRLSRMQSNDFFIENCDYIIYNNNHITDINKQLDDILKEIDK